jgi:hypothetical protein
MSLVGLLFVTLLMVALPGWLLVNAAFPPRRSQLSWVERGYLSLAGGALLLILVGVVLGLLPHGRRGYFETFATGMPNVELALLGASALLFYVGLLRGAYPWVAARFPRLLSPDGKKAPPSRAGE